jgi:hypothetical protein
MPASLRDKYVEIPISKLVEAQWNYKQDDDKKATMLMEKLKANLARNGQIENLIVRTAKADGYFEVVNGNHRLRALKALGVKTAVCFKLGKITQAHAERIAVETNETKFASDPLKLAQIIRNVMEEFKPEDVIETMPFTQDEMDNYTKMLDFDWDALDDVAKPDVDEHDPTKPKNEDDEWETVEFRLPVMVAELFQAQVERIKRLLYPDKTLKDISYVPAIECLTAHLDQISDEEIVSQ